MIAIASDHGGFALKESIKLHLDKTGTEYKDFGVYSGESCDYPAIALKPCQAVVSGQCEMALLFCGTGIGISIAANKVKGIRAAVCIDAFSARYSRLHNNANVLCLGGRVVGEGLAAELVDIFINTQPEGGRHAKRVRLITEIEENQ